MPEGVTVLLTTWSSMPTAATDGTIPAKRDKTQQMLMILFHFGYFGSGFFTMNPPKS